MGQELAIVTAAPPQQHAFFPPEAPTPPSEAPTPRVNPFDRRAYQTRIIHDKIDFARNAGFQIGAGPPRATLAREMTRNQIPVAVPLPPNPEDDMGYEPANKRPCSALEYNTKLATEEALTERNAMETLIHAGSELQKLPPIEIQTVPVPLPDTGGVTVEKAIPFWTNIGKPDSEEVKVPT